MQSVVISASALISSWSPFWIEPSTSGVSDMITRGLT